MVSNWPFSLLHDTLPPKLGLQVIRLEPSLIRDPP